jgi:hypothetical protein
VKTPGAGDVIELDTGQGTFAYLHLMHHHPSYPPVVRALPGRYDARPDLGALLAQEGGQLAMVALVRGLEESGLSWQVIGNRPVQGPFPTFRTAVRDRAGRVLYWWLWDGDTLRHVTELDDSTATAPLREVADCARFLRDIAQG